MASTAISEQGRYGGLKTKVSVPAGEYSPWYPVGDKAAIAVRPGATGTMKAQYTYDLPQVYEADNGTGVTTGVGNAVAIDWTPGSVAAATAALIEKAVAVRFQAVTAAGVGLISR